MVFGDLANGSLLYLSGRSEVIMLYALVAHGTVQYLCNLLTFSRS